jgi:predicted O-linked N-acetylglucosamine transferase (SPINDLY family)
MVSRGPEEVNGLLNQGLEAHRQGRFQEAEERYRQAMLAGGEAGREGRFLCGTLLLQLGRLPEAVALLSQSAEESPGDYRSWLNLGEALRLAGRLEEAGQAARQALLLAPALPAAQVLLGNLDRAAGRSLDALRHYRQALNGEPGLEAAWVNATALLLELGKAREARDEALAGLTLCSAPELKKLLGRAMFALGEIAAAIDAFLQAGDAESLVMAALIRHDEGNDEEAHRFFRRALEADPYSALARYNRARVLRGENKLDEAVADLRVCVEHHPSYRPALGFAAELMPLVGDFAGQEAVKGRLLSLGVVEGEVAAAPFEILCLADDCSLQLAAARQVAKELPSPKPRPPVPGGRACLTIGYLSSDFVNHALSRVMAGVFEHHDRGAFKVVAYATRTDDGSDIAARIRGAADAVRDVAGLRPQEVASLIVQDGVDILVDLNGHTWGSMLGVLGYRPAPVQATYMGYPGTTGYEAVDYLIADGFVVPPEAEKYYSEAVVRLPHCYWAPDDKPAEAESLSRKDCGLPDEDFVFACFNRANKFSGEMVGTWLSILSQVPRSVLWLVAEHPSLQRSLRERAMEAGVSPERLVFSAPAAYGRYLGRLARVDLFLDTYPYNAHTLAFDALRLGTLILTLCGQSFAARVAGSMLNALGLHELIAPDATAYREQAVALAHDPAKLDSLRRRLREVRGETPVFDTEVFTRHLEEAYRSMWQRARMGLGPDAISVPEKGSDHGA